MIPYDLDPSLHSTAPQEPALDDGFSRPAAQEPAQQPAASKTGEAPVDPALWEKSDF